MESSGRELSRFSLALEPHVLIGGEDRQRDQVDRVIGHSRSDPYQHAGVPDRCEHRSVDRELLDAMQQGFPLRGVTLACLDRKSTRLNSSHSQISYAVFCLKKKKTIRDRMVCHDPGDTWL